jgi:hypothetical protein
MTPEQEQASFLIQTLGRERAIEHFEFVLGDKFRLEPIPLRIWWEKVLKLVKEEK